MEPLRTEPAARSRSRQTHAGFREYDEKERLTQPVQLLELDLEHPNIPQLYNTDALFYTRASRDKVRDALVEAQGGVGDDPVREAALAEQVAAILERVVTVPATTEQVEQSTDAAVVGFLMSLGSHNDSMDRAVAHIARTLEDGFFAEGATLYEQMSDEIERIVTHGPFEDSDEEQAARRFVIDALQGMYHWFYKPLHRIYDNATLDLPTFQRNCVMDKQREMTLIGVAAVWAGEALRRFPDDAEVAAVARRLQFEFEQPETAQDIPITIPIKHPVLDAPEDYWRIRQFVGQDQMRGGELPSIRELMNGVNANLEFTLEQEALLKKESVEYAEALNDLIGWVDRLREHIHQYVREDNELTSVSLDLFTQDDQRELLRALFIVKQEDPELYISIMGQVVDTSIAEHSEFFGNVIQLAVANTEDRVQAERDRGERVWLWEQIQELHSLHEKEIPPELTFGAAQLEHFYERYSRELKEEKDPDRRVELNTVLTTALLPMLMTVHKIQAAREYRHDRILKMQQLREVADPVEFVKLAKSLTSAELQDKEIRSLIERRGITEYRIMAGKGRDIPLSYNIDPENEEDLEQLRVHAGTVIKTAPKEAAARYLVKNFTRLGKQIIGLKLSDLIDREGPLDTEEKILLKFFKLRPDITADEWADAVADLYDTYGRGTGWGLSSEIMGGSRLNRLDGRLLAEDIPVELAKYLIRHHEDSINIPAVKDRGKRDIAALVSEHLLGSENTEDVKQGISLASWTIRFQKGEFTREAPLLAAALDAAARTGTNSETTGALLLLALESGTGNLPARAIELMNDEAFEFSSIASLDRDLMLQRVLEADVDDALKLRFFENNALGPDVLSPDKQGALWFMVLEAELPPEVKIDILTRYAEHAAVNEQQVSRLLSSLDQDAETDKAMKHRVAEIAFSKLPLSQNAGQFKLLLEHEYDDPAMNSLINEHIEKSIASVDSQQAVAVFDVLARCDTKRFAFGSTEHPIVPLVLRHIEQYELFRRLLQLPAEFWGTKKKCFTRIEQLPPNTVVPLLKGLAADPDIAELLPHEPGADPDLVLRFPGRLKIAAPRMDGFRVKDVDPDEDPQYAEEDFMITLENVRPEMPGSFAEDPIRVVRAAPQVFERGTPVETDLWIDDWDPKSMSEDLTFGYDPHAGKRGDYSVGYSLFIKVESPKQKRERRFLKIVSVPVKMKL